MPVPFLAIAGAAKAGIGAASTISSFLSGRAHQKAGLINRNAAIGAAADGVNVAKRTTAKFESLYDEHDRLYSDVRADLYNFSKRYAEDGGTKIKSQRLQRVRASFERSQRHRRALQARAGISADSGLSIEQEIQAFNQLQQEEGQIAYEAPLQAASILQNFLSTGTQREAALLGGISNSTGQVVNASAELASQYSANAQVHEEYAQQAATASQAIGASGKAFDAAAGLFGAS